MSILQLRTTANKSREQVAVDTCSSARSVARWELGQSVPNAATMSRLARSLGVPMSDIMGAFGLHEVA